MACPRITVEICVAIVLATASCADRTRQGSADYRTVPSDPHRDTASARRLDVQGREQMAKGEIKRAAELFKQALTADVEYGPAHNNLGKVYFRQKDWYQAAWEFEYAGKLMPRRAEPRNNLGLVLERSGDLDKAIDRYHEAVELDPDNVEYRGNLARALIQRGDRNEEVLKLLETIAQRDTRPEWQTWAKRHLATMQPQPKPAP